MYMEPRDMQCWPKCTQLIQGLETIVMRSNLKLKAAFFKACQADDQDDKSPPKKVEGQIRKALHWSTGPLIQVVEGLVHLPNDSDGRPQTGCGYQPPFKGSENTILITSLWFEAYEFVPVFREHNSERLIRTLLHETIHWVRSTSNASDQIRFGGFKGQYQEAGHWFEGEYFGSNNICTDDELDGALAGLTEAGEALRQQRRTRRLEF